MTRTRLYAALPLGVCMVLAGCGDQPAAIRAANIDATNGVASLISDAARDVNGIGGFYFRPPIVAEVAYPGTFDPTLAPEVVICEWTAGACTARIASFDLNGGTDGEVIHIEADHYHVNWHTSGLDPAKTYRILVNASGLPLGFADVDVVDNGSELRNVHTQQYIPLLNGRTLPIMFRAESGIAGRITVDPPEILMEVGDAQPVTATVYDLHDAEMPNAVPGWALGYTAGGAGSATFETGTLSAVSPSMGTLTASFAGRSANASFRIFDPPVSLEFATSCGSLRIGVPTTITATAFDAAHEPITRPSLRIRYASSDQNIILADQNSGSLTGLARGYATVTASVMSLNASARLLAFGETDVITIAPANDAQATSLTLEAGEEADLAGTFSGEAIIAATYGGCRVWSADDPAVASVSDDGHIVAEGAGETTIRLAIGDLKGSFPLVVELTPPPPDEPPTGDPGPACDDAGCIVHPTGTLNSRAMDVNVRGEMVIWAQRTEGGTRNRAFYWDGNVEHAPMLLDQSDAVHCIPYAINASGEIVGHCTWPRGSTKTGGVYWARHDAPIEVLPNIVNPPGMLIGTIAQDINDAGVIVGGAPRFFPYPGTGVLTPAGAAARWDSHTATPVTFAWANPWIGPGGRLFGISPSGRMSGQTTVALRHSTGVLLDVPHAGALAANAPVNTKVADLGSDFVPPNNDGQSIAARINDAGTMVGWMDTFISTNVIRHRAVRWPNGGVRTSIPGVPGASIAGSEASDVNEAGWITGGWGTGPGFVVSAFVWKGNTAVPAMALPRPSNSVSARANAVSQVFDGPNGAKHAYLAGQVSITTSSNYRAVRWLVKQTAAELQIPPLP